MQIIPRISNFTFGIDGDLIFSTDRKVYVLKGFHPFHNESHKIVPVFELYPMNYAHTYSPPELLDLNEIEFAFSQVIFEEDNNNLICDFKIYYNGPKDLNNLDFDRLKRFLNEYLINQSRSFKFISFLSESLGIPINQFGFCDITLYSILINSIFLKTDKDSADLPYFEGENGEEKFISISIFGFDNGLKVRELIRKIIENKINVGPALKIRPFNLKQLKTRYNYYFKEKKEIKDNLTIYDYIKSANRRILSGNLDNSEYYIRFFEFSPWDIDDLYNYKGDLKLFKIYHDFYYNYLSHIFHEIEESKRHKHKLFADLCKLPKLTIKKDLDIMAYIKIDAQIKGDRNWWTLPSIIYLDNVHVKEIKKIIWDLEQNNAKPPKKKMNNDPLELSAVYRRLENESIQFIYTLDMKFVESARLLEFIEAAGYLIANDKNLFVIIDNILDNEAYIKIL
ncbi:MAG: hypothetical protein ACTSU2_01065 [Promethearchaeota archaeon]